jgi:hypothetical protein
MIEKMPQVIVLKGKTARRKRIMAELARSFQEEIADGKLQISIQGEEEDEAGRSSRDRAMFNKGRK